MDAKHCDNVYSAAGAAHAALFGEDQARYVVSVAPQAVSAVLAAATSAGVGALQLGTVGGEALTLPGEVPILVADLRSAHESWLPAYMAAAE
jgi:phosphoribosylformylglycinamidine synthase